MISTQDYIEAFRVLLPDLNDRKVHALHLLAEHRDSGITAQKIAAAVGARGYGAANAWIGNLGKALYWHLKRYPSDVPATPDGYYQMLANGQRIQGEGYLWRMRPEVFNALVALNFIKPEDSAVKLPEEITGEDPLRFREGAVTSIYVNAYERCDAARQACLSIHGYLCACCDIDLQARYGLPNPFIHVHHLQPIAGRGGEYDLDPREDLRPVCPNCHAIIHLSRKLLTIDDVRRLLGKL